MKKTKKYVFSVLTMILSASLFAESITLNWGANTYDINIPAEVADIVKQNKTTIEQTLLENNVDIATISAAIPKINNFYSNLNSYGIKTTTPFTTATDSLNDFSEKLNSAFPNSQTQQNVWGQAWIGKLPHFGFGVNAGATKLSVKALKDAVSALSIDVGDVKDDYFLPTVTADARIGGIIFPFDAGITFCTIDSTKIGTDIKPIKFDFYTLGIDVRYALLKGNGIKPRLSVGTGFYYTDGCISADNDNSKASLNFTSTTVFMSTQASVKLLCLVPFVGGRVLFSKTNVDWKAQASWDSIYQGGSLIDVQKWGILPTSFSGGDKSGFFDNIKPQLYAGLTVDLLFVDFTASACYDIASSIPSAAVSLRFAL